MSNATRQLAVRNRVDELALELFMKVTGLRKQDVKLEWHAQNAATLDNYRTLARDLIGRENLIKALIVTNKRLRMKLRNRAVRATFLVK